MIAKGRHRNVNEDKKNEELHTAYTFIQKMRRDCKDVPRRDGPGKSFVRQHCKQDLFKQLEKLLIDGPQQLLAVQEIGKRIVVIKN